MTVIVYKPLGGTEPTVNDPRTVPVVLTVHVPGGKVPTRAPPTPSRTLLHVVGAPVLSKPDPEIDTTVPAGPEFGLRTIRGTTEKLGVLTAGSPPGVPVTVNE